MTQDPLKDQIAKFQSEIIDNASVGIAFLDTNGRFLHANSAFLELVEYTLAELSGLSWKQITYFEDVKDDEEMRAKLFAGQVEHFRILKRYVKKSGNWIWVKLDVRALKEENVVKLVVTNAMELITDPETKRALEQLKDAQAQQEERLQKMVEELQRANAFRERLFAFIEKWWWKIGLFVLLLAASAGSNGLATVLASLGLGVATGAPTP